MNSVYIYQDTFLHLLNLIVYLIEHKIKPFQIKNTSYTATLLDQVVTLDIPEKEEILSRMIEKVGIRAFHTMYYVFLSDVENKELILYYFYLNGLKYKTNILNYRNLKCVDKVIKISQMVRNECHKYKGFVRFRELQNHILYAEIEPTSDCLRLLSNHFQKRLKNEYWIIKDVKRNILSLYDRNKYILVDADTLSFETILESEEEKTIGELWKTFYKTIGIQERRNERCRMNFMPKKYWKYMLEVEEER